MTATSWSASSGCPTSAARSRSPRTAMAVDDAATWATPSARTRSARSSSRSRSPRPPTAQATVLTLGAEDAVEQLRDALARRVHRRGARRGGRRRRTARPTWPPRSPRWSARTRRRARSYDLVLLGNDAADTGDFQVGIRLAYVLDRPVVTGVSTLSRSQGDRVTARGEGPDGARRSSRCRCPRCVTVMEGGVEPRYPSIPGRMKAKRVADRDGRAEPRAARLGTGPAQAAARRRPARCRCWARDPRRPGPSSTCSSSWE